MIDGVASLQTMFFGMHAAGLWRDERGTNATDSGSHFYQVYECADGQWVSVAALEATVSRRVAEAARGRCRRRSATQMDPANWPKAKEILAARFRTKTRAEWCAIARRHRCVLRAGALVARSAAPSAPRRARRLSCEIDGVVQPAPAPRFSRSGQSVPTLPRGITPEGTREALSAWLAADEIEALCAAGTV